MHIAVDCRSIHPYMGGIGRATSQLMHQLSRQHTDSHRITAILGGHAGESEAEGLSVARVDAAMIDEPFEQLVLPGILEDLKADIYVGMCYSIPAIKTTARQVSVIHDVVFEDHPEWVEAGLRDYLKRWARFAAAMADRVVTVSDYSMERIRSVYGVESLRLCRIYNGVPEAAFSRPETRDIDRIMEKYGLRDGAPDRQPPVILYLGSLEPKKGIPELLGAFDRLASRGFEGVLALAGGKGGMGFDPEAAVRATSCPDRIRCLGYVDEGDKKALYAGCSLFVYPSLYEGFGMPPLEAMALGVPCLVSRSTSIPEVAGDVAVQVDVGDTTAFADGLDRGLHDGEFRTRARTAGPARARMFSWDVAARQLVETCESLCS